MKYLKNKLTVMVALLMVTSNIYCQSNNEVSDLKDFSGIWTFIPPDGSNDTTFVGIDIIAKNLNIDLTYWKESKKCTVLGINIIGFAHSYESVKKISDLENKGQRMYFYKNNLNAPNDSIKYFEEASPSCFASFNGIGIDDFEPSKTKNAPNCLFFNFNGRDYERWEQRSHLPNYIVESLIKQNRKDWEKVRQLLPHDYKMVVNDKAIIYSQLETATRMYILKNDVVEINETKGDWLKIKYYIEKNNKDTGKTIEGWIKRSDVE